MAERQPPSDTDVTPPPPGESGERRARPRERPSPVAAVVERNIASLLERRKAEDRARATQDRIADAVTRFTGSLTFVYIHLALFATWIAVNLVPGLPHFDPQFTVLAMAASVEAIFLSTFVLISQNRMQAQADKRADLDLQVSLLAEHEVTQTITLVREIARRMGIEEANDAALDELQQDIEPVRVLDTMEASQERILSRGARE